MSAISSMTSTGTIVQMRNGAYWPRLSYDEVLELAFDIVGDLRLPSATAGRNDQVSVEKFVKLAVDDMALIVRCDVEANEVACLVMDWQIALCEDRLNFAFETATLLEVAVELVINRGMCAGDALYAELTQMPSRRLTTWDHNFDVWFATYGRARSGCDAYRDERLTGSEQDVSNDIDVIVTPLCLRVGMIEHQFCPTASQQVTVCDRAPTGAVARFGLDAYREVGRLVAARGVETSEGLVESGVASVDRRELDDVFEEFAISLDDIDLPPLPCLLLSEQYRTWFFDVLLPDYWRPGFASVAEAAYDGAVEWLWQLRCNARCCSSGCAP